MSCSTLKVDWGPTTTPEERVFQNVLEFPDYSQEKIFEKSREWMVKTFIDSESVVEYTNSEEGKIMGKYSQTDVTVTGVNANYHVRSVITIEAKDGKARVTIEDPYMISFVSPHVQGRQYVNSPIDKELFINSLKTNEWQAIIDSYSKYISTENEDW